MILNDEHFSLLASNILNGSCPIRRWFVECHPKRRMKLVKIGLVSRNITVKKTNTPNVFTIARRKDETLWKQGERDSSRLPWLNAPKYAYEGAKKYKADMQSTTCNWDRACAVRHAASTTQQTLRLSTLATVASMTVA
jgi:hypothetical protein